jgi:glycosyltransferase involved in cell wall biosynthesis
VAGQYDHIPSPLPANVEILREIPLEQTYDLLSRAAVAVAPLLPAERSTGQVFFFEAMAMGKPVVATRSIGTTDYLSDNENALLVEPTNPQALAAAVNRLLADSALAARLAAQALKECQSDWTPDAHARHKLQAIAELYAPAQSHTGGL